MQPDFSPLRKIIGWLLVGVLAGSATGYGVNSCQHRRVVSHAEATITQQAAHVAADAQARCAADQRAAFLAGRQYESQHADSLRHAHAPAHSLPALPEHPPRQ